jgi:signal transduction histidine kinase
MQALYGRIAVVVAGSDGVGAAIARCFGELGASVVVNYASDKAGADRLVAINEVIGEMVLLLRHEAGEYAVSIRMDLAAGLPKITADRVQLQQVLMNLMLNGIEAMKEIGGVLTAKTERDECGQVLISVSDTGVGLPTGTADEIFNAFFTTKPQGSGMGLAISKSIVESHGGRIWANGDSGCGATFHVTLPTAPAETNRLEDVA